jgi:hypothetical protein
VIASKSKPLAIYGPRLRLSRGGRGSYSTPPKPGARPYFMMRHKDKLLDDCDPTAWAMILRRCGCSTFKAMPGDDAAERNAPVYVRSP